MFSSLRSRLWLSYALLILAALGFVFLVMVIYLLRNPLLYRQTITKLKAIETVVLRRQDEFLGSNERELERALVRADENFDVRLIFFDGKGAVIYDTRADESEIALPRVNALRSKIMLNDDAGKAWLYSLSRLDNGQRLLVATPRPNVQILSVLRDELLPPFWSAGTIALLLSLLLAFLMARWVADPLQRMLTATREVPMQGVNTPEKGPQEVRELTQAFNEMVLRVQSTQQSQREFVANVSHELKTPLTSIQGFAQALLDGAAETPESRRQAAQVIYDESGRMHRLALDLLDLARFDAGIVEMAFAPIDLAALLRNTSEKFALQASQKNIKLEIHVSGDLEVWGDGDRLAQVFTNLVDNALKHTPSGGSVQVKADDYGGEKHIEIRDTGAGIPPEALPYIFERFYQADPSRSRKSEHSSGLGLAIANEIVLAHGGKISVRSKVKEGTSFDVIIPRALYDETTLISRRKA
ncbi:MAG: HAMP domain-containing histidine kinase [Anaerolineae bacterium]|jgi:signal transduction histidine kinase|nr:HAMP domain-containing histidine kinase [Anaerolineae bacterium]MBT7191419.1 HAMP domain-containing histidine kinase [Anaerolineae bacterium]MBT7992021.1 HAMP domain-containing histidine kinase [Anaerolineae bacterium]